MNRDIQFLKIKVRSRRRISINRYFLFLLFIFLSYSLFLVDAFSSQFLYWKDYVIFKSGKNFEFTYFSDVATSFFFIEPILGRFYLILSKVFEFFFPFLSFTNLLKIVHVSIVFAILLVLFFEIKYLFFNYLKRSLINLTSNNFSIKRENRGFRVILKRFSFLLSFLFIGGFMISVYFFVYGNIYNLFLFFLFTQIMFFFTLFLITENEVYQYISLMFWCVLMFSSIIFSIILFLIFYISFLSAYIIHLIVRYIFFRKISNKGSFNLFQRVQEHFLLIFLLLMFILTMYWKLIIFLFPYVDMSLITFKAISQKEIIYLIFVLILSLFFVFRMRDIKFWIMNYFLLVFMVSTNLILYLLDDFLKELLFSFAFLLICCIGLIGLFIFERRNYSKIINIAVLLFILIIFFINLGYFRMMQREEIFKYNAVFERDIKEINSFISKIGNNSYVLILRGKNDQNSLLAQNYDKLLSSYAFYSFNGKNQDVFSEIWISSRILFEPVLLYLRNRTNLSKINLFLLIDALKIDYLISDEHPLECLSYEDGNTFKLYSTYTCLS
ncbi:MAG: hypothetical protein QXD62_02835 [Candidatus Woesearchaeota archaeon]